MSQLIICIVLQFLFWNNNDDFIDKDHHDYSKPVEVLNIQLKNVPLYHFRDGVTYVNDILIVNDEYSLPENYAPGLSQEVLDAFYNMQYDAEQLGLHLVLISGFRSYQSQANIYNQFVETLGREAANERAALPGHSEHQSGLAIDVGSVESASNAAINFGETEEFQWMKDHMHDYGFILRFHEGKESITGVMYEPWHIRYVGNEASKIYKSDLVLEEYLNIDD